MKSYLSNSSQAIQESNFSLDTDAAKKLALSKTASWKKLFSTVLHNWRSRRRLQELNEYQLKDIGLTSVDVYAEVHKKLWEK